MMEPLELIIEEGIWDINKKSPLRRAIYKYDGERITRQLFILGDKEHLNDKIEVYDKAVVSYKEIKEKSISDLGDMLKCYILNFFNCTITEELKFFKTPIITEIKNGVASQLNNTEL